VADKARATGTVYRDEAAELMAAAARGTTRQPPPELELTARRAAPDVRLEPKRPLPYPEPVALNDNADEDDDYDDVPQAPRRQRRRLSFVQLVAWIIVAPLYLAVAAGSIAIIALFVTRFLAA
jgi:hypothetical protein